MNTHATHGDFCRWLDGSGDYFIAIRDSITKNVYANSVVRYKHGKSTLLNYRFEHPIHKRNPYPDYEVLYNIADIASIIEAKD